MIPVVTMVTILYPIQDLRPDENGWKCDGFINFPVLWSINLSGLYSSGLVQSVSEKLV